MSATKHATLSRFFFGVGSERGAETLSPWQVRWLGALMIAAQLPQAIHLPIGIALIGLTLVALRFLLLKRSGPNAGAAKLRLPSWALGVFAAVIA